MEQNRFFPPPSLSNKERLIWCKERKMKINRDRVARWRQKNKPKNKDMGRKKEIVRQQTKERMRKYREKQRRAKETNTFSVRNETDNDENKQNENVYDNGDDENFSNRMQRSRALRKLKNVLNEFGAAQRCEMISSLLNSASPKSRKTRLLLEEKEVIVSKSVKIKNKVAESLIKDFRNGLKVLNPEKKGQVLSACVGNNVRNNKVQREISKETGVHRNTLRKSVKLHKKVVSGEEDAWKYTKRKTRKDRISDEDKKIVFDYWKENSVPVNDKKKMIRERVGPKAYTEHVKHITPKTQTEMYTDFKKKHPAVNIKQRSFEKLRPYFVKPANRRDQITCLCKQHHEIELLFSAAKKHRHSLIEKRLIRERIFPEFTVINDLVKKTLCKEIEINGVQMHKLECIERKCSKCGVEKLKLCALEMSDSCTCANNKIKWQKYGYIKTGKQAKSGQEIKKLKLVQMETSPEAFWVYFKEKLVDYPLHQFHATWQREQLKQISSNLPQGHVLFIHDYSEDFKCCGQDKIQSEFYSKNEIAIHVSVLFRHAVFDTDGLESTEETPEILKEYCYVIFDETSHDKDTVHHARKLLIEYLQKDLNYPLSFIHEFTDGCTIQYKSKYCMADISCSENDFNSITQRNFFESSHGKGEQDAAGSHIKNRAMMAIIRRECKLDTALDLCNFLKDKFTVPASRLSSFTHRQQAVQLHRRLFFHVTHDDIAKDRRTQPVRPIKDNRKQHSVRGVSGHPGELMMRRRACYCNMCIDENYNECEFLDIVGRWENSNVIHVELPSSSETCYELLEEDVSDTSFTVAGMVGKGDVVVIQARDEQMDYVVALVISDFELVEDEIYDKDGTHFDTGEFVVIARPYHFSRSRSFIRFWIDEPKSESIHISQSDIKYTMRNENIIGKKTTFKVSLETHEEIMACL